jgi:hypothetical protein
LGLRRKIFDENIEIINLELKNYLIPLKVEEENNNNQGRCILALRGNRNKYLLEEDDDD